MLANPDVVFPQSSLVTQPRLERERGSRVRQPDDRDDTLVVLCVFDRNCMSIFLISTTRQLERSFTNYGLRHAFQSMRSSV